MAAEEYGALNAELAEPEELAAEVVLAYDGLSPTAKVEETEAGAKITVVDKHGTTTATVKNGKDGATGAPGAHIGPEAPTNGEKLWVDTDEAPEESETEGGTQIDVVAKAGQLLSVAEVDADGKPTKWQAVDLPKAETPDWNANEGEKGYIEGRTHYVDEKGIVHKLPNKFIDADWMATSRVNDQSDYIIVKEQTVTSMWSGLDERLQPGFVYDVYINDMLYACEAFNEDGGICLGNNTSLTKNSYPFCIYWAGGSAKAGFFYKDSEVLGSSVLLKVTHHSYTEYNKLPVDFLPDEAALKNEVDKAIEEKDTETKAYIVEYTKPINDAVAANSNAVEKKITAPVTAEVGQTIIVKEVDENGKPTKWEAADYQPRTHGKEIAELLPNTQAVFSEDDGSFIVEFGFDFVAGNAYSVNWNGVIYNCVAVDMDGDVAIGNVGVISGEGDSGEPFFAGANSGMLFALPLDGSTELVIGVSGEVYQTIDKNYLPTDIMYGYPKYSYGAFDLERYCWMEAGETNITGKTDGFVNTALTKEQFDILTEVFTNQVVYLDSCDMFVKPGMNGDAWQIQYTAFSHALNMVSVKSVTLTLQWSDTEGCVQRSCEARSNNLSLIS